jgi:hypothetical protein
MTAAPHAAFYYVACDVVLIERLERQLHGVKSCIARLAIAFGDFNRVRVCIRHTSSLRILQPNRFENIPLPLSESSRRS